MQVMADGDAGTGCGKVWMSSLINQPRLTWLQGYEDESHHVRVFHN